jgi:hypothetical protein
MEITPLLPDGYEGATCRGDPGTHNMLPDGSLFAWVWYWSLYASRETGTKAILLSFAFRMASDGAW